MNLEVEWGNTVVPASPIKEQGQYRCSSASPSAEFYGEPPDDRATGGQSRGTGLADTPTEVADAQALLRELGHFRCEGAT